MEFCMHNIITLWMNMVDTMDFSILGFCFVAGLSLGSSHKWELNYQG